MNLSEVQIFCIYEVTKVIVICKDKQLVIATF